MYDTEFAIVYSAALEATRELYPNIDDHPAPGKIQTAWQEVQSASCSGGGGTGCDEMVNQRVLSQQRGPAATSPAASMAGMPTRLAYKRFFIRFDVHVFGGRPWRVRVTGHASSWDPGAAMPVELRGADKPGWLEGRTEALQIAIYRRIRQYAIPMKDQAPEEAMGPKSDPAMFTGVPRDAARVLADIKDALAKRDYATIKPRLASDVLWSAGGGRGADSAMATWLADPIAFDAMAFALAKCSGNFQRVTCPSGTVVPGAYQLVLEARPGGWKIVSFATAE